MSRTYYIYYYGHLYYTLKFDIINKMVKTVLPVGQTVESDSLNSTYNILLQLYT